MAGDINVDVELMFAGVVGVDVAPVSVGAADIVVDVSAAGVSVSAED